MATLAPEASPPGGPNAGPDVGADDSAGGAPDPGRSGLRRILTGLLLGALLVPAVFLLPSQGFLALALVVTGLAMVELIALLRRFSPATPFAALLVAHPLLAAGLALLAGPGAEGAGSIWAAALAGALLVSLAIALTGRGPLEETAPASALGLLALVYLALPVVSVYHLHERDPGLLFFVVVFVVLGDVLAYYVGSAIGKRRLAPRVSPNKSWEGAMASFAGALACAFLYSALVLDAIDAGFVLLVAASAVAAQLGDLFESLFKRAAGVKDSGTLLPGHGGVLDRLDALFFAFPAFYLGSLWLYPEAVS